MPPYANVYINNILRMLIVMKTFSLGFAEKERVDYLQIRRKTHILLVVIDTKAITNSFDMVLTFARASILDLTVEIYSSYV